MATNQLTSVVKQLCRVLARSESSNLNDSQLLESFIRCGDQAALEVLVHRHGPMVMGVCRRHLHNQDDAEDAFQATFLILVRKAASIINRERVAGWLYTVACKTAVRARGLAAKRRGNESQVNAMPEPAVMDQQHWNEVQRVLDLELSLLPEKYRDPIVLCHIEGKTLKEAARQLRCPEGTVSGRLSRARSSLRKRLAKHGVVVPAMALAAALTQNATAAVPAKVVVNVVEAASLLVSGQTAAIAATRSVILMNAVLRGMLITKLKAAVIFVVLALFGLAAANQIFEAASARPAAAEPLSPRNVNEPPPIAVPGNLPERPVAVAAANQSTALPGNVNEPAAPAPDKNAANDTPAPTAGIRLMAKTSIAADMTDLSPRDYGVGSNYYQFGSISGIAYTGKDDLYVLLADRGPEDGNTNYLCRFHTMKITVTGDGVKTSLQSTTLLRDENDRPFIGFLGALKPTDKLADRLDPEGVRVSSRGTIYVSDEYGPHIDEFGPQGKRIKRFPVPARFQVQTPDADPTQELKRNKTGREPNHGMEGLALTPDGRKLVAAMQSPLIQDGGRKGVNVRFLEIDVATDQTREFLYPLQEAGASVSEILAVNDHEFLVLERGKRFCKIFKIDLAGASEIQHLKKLPATGLPKGVAPVAKQLFLDMNDPRFGIQGEVAKKVEGLTFGPDLPDGSRLLIVATDNDLKADEPTRFFAFAVGRAELPGWQALPAESIPK